MRFFKKLFRPRTPQKRYEKEKKIIAGKDPDKKRKIAASPDSHPEILFYLANDKDVNVRRSVAGNVTTPIQASDILVRDPDDDVRLQLAERLVKLLPDLAQDMQSQLYAFAVKSLGTLARDEVGRIRVSLSTALKDHAYAPPTIVKTLAKDVEREVSEPILRHCVKLTDDDLMEILSHHPEDWAVQAIAQRKELGDAPATDIIEHGSEEQGRILVKNSHIRLSRENLQAIVSKSEHYISWQEPVALRAELSYDLAQQLVGFAEDAVMNVLLSRKDFDKQTAAEVAALVRRRSDFAAADNPIETLDQKLNRYLAAGKLNATTIMDAIAWREEGFVKLAIARIAGVHQVIVEKIFASQSPKSIIALAWYAGLPMRVAVELQKSLGRVPVSQLIYARDGIDYPIPREDMIWQLEFFGIEVKDITEDEQKNANANGEGAS